MRRDVNADLAHHLVGPRDFEEADLRGHAMLAPLNLYPDEMDALLSNRDRIRRTVESLA